MTTEKVYPKTSAKDVLPAMANLLSLYDKQTITAAPLLAQRMFEELMVTTFGNDLHYREQMLMMLSLMRDFSSALEPFSQDTLLMATSKTRN